MNTIQTYLVGGAVRDQLLGHPIKDRDWVVVGTTPQAMLQQGFRPVGKDFPVFLHPETQEEYALARTERKTAPGYHGFAFNTDPSVTLADDLARRDLTINALALDNNGQVIDYYGGQADLKQRILRHVSPAFAEDPVRVLRVARFAARFATLGFKVAPETLQLMRSLVVQGEITALVAERVWQEMHKALGEPHPEMFFQVLQDCGALTILLPELAEHLERDKPAKTFAPLINTTALSPEPLLRFAALMSQESVRGLETFNECYRVPNEYYELALLSIQHLPRLQNLGNLSVQTILDTLLKIDALRRPKRFNQLLIVSSACYFDPAMQNTLYPITRTWQALHHACEQVDVQRIIRAGYQGSAIKQQLHLEYCNVIAAALQSQRMS